METPNPRTKSNQTPPADRLIELGFVKTLIETEVGRKIPRSTWSDWCRRLMGNTIPARRNTPVSPAIAAGIITIGNLSKYGVGCYHGPQYKQNYPLVLQRLMEIIDND